MLKRLAQRFRNQPERPAGARICTLAFTSLNGYAEIAARVTPDRLGEYMRRYLDGQAAAISAHGGKIAQLIGDTIFAYWDSPAGTVQCCQSMLAQREAAIEFCRWAEGRQLPTATIRVGAHMGPVMVASVPPGSAARVLGDAVNLASRLDPLNKEYGTQFLVSDAIVAQLDHDWVTRLADTVRVKGKEHPVRLYELVGLYSALDKSAVEFLSAYATGAQAFSEGRFDDAILALESVLRQRPEDRLAALFLARSREFQEHPPSGSWDGVYTFRLPP